jgi:methyl-accepting chemotaxis protein
LEQGEICMLKRLKIGPKLIGGFLLVSLLSVFVGIMGISGMEKIRATSDEIANIRIPSVIHINNINESMTAIQRGERSAIMAVQNFDMEAYRNQIDILQQDWGMVEENWQTYEAIKKTDREMEIWKNFVDKFGSWKSDHEQVIDLVSQASLDEAAQVSLGQTNKSFHEVKQILEQLVAIQKEIAQADSKAANERYKSIRNVTGLAIFGAVFAALIIGLTLTLSITRPIGKVAALAKRISDYDLTSEKINIKSEDEVGMLADGLNIMSEKLTEMVATINRNTEQLASAANEISSSSEQLSAGVKEQTNQTAQVSVAVEQVTTSIVEVSKNIEDAAEKARGAGSKSREGSDLARETSRGMEEIVKSSDITAGNIIGLAEKATAIGEIISVINDIADQTNLLALNAAIEAARAGEQGRGFAVVADEVRKLAERTTKATKEVAETIKGIQSDVGAANEQIGDAKRNVDSGKELVQKTNNSLDEIFAAIEIVQQMMRQVAAASKEQSSSAEQISKNVENVDRITRETASGAEQSASAAEQLNRQAEELKKLVGGFKLKQDVTA